MISVKRIEWYCKWHAIGHRWNLERQIHYFPCYKLLNLFWCRCTLIIHCRHTLFVQRPAFRLYIYIPLRTRFLSPLIFIIFFLFISHSINVHSLYHITSKSRWFNPTYMHLFQYSIYLYFFLLCAIRTKLYLLYTMKFVQSHTALNTFMRFLL